MSHSLPCSLIDSHRSRICLLRTALFAQALRYAHSFVRSLAQFGARDMNLFPMSSGVSERASERMSAAERTSEVSSTEQANGGAVRVNERVEERVSQYSTS